MMCVRTMMQTKSSSTLAINCNNDAKHSICKFKRKLAGKLTCKMSCLMAMSCKGCAPNGSRKAQVLQSVSAKWLATVQSAPGTRRQLWLHLLDLSTRGTEQAVLPRQNPEGNLWPPGGARRPARHHIKHSRY